MTTPSPGGMKKDGSAKQCRYVCSFTHVAEHEVISQTDVRECHHGLMWKPTGVRIPGRHGQVLIEWKRTRRPLTTGATRIAPE